MWSFTVRGVVPDAAARVSVMLMVAFVPTVISDPAAPAEPVPANAPPAPPVNVTVS